MLIINSETPGVVCEIYPMLMPGSDEELRLSATKILVRENGTLRMTDFSIGDVTRETAIYLNTVALAIEIGCLKIEDEIDI